MIRSLLLLSIVLASTPQRQDLTIYPNRKPDYWAWLKWDWKVEDSKLTSSVARIDALSSQGASSVRELEELALFAKTGYEKAPKPDAKLLTVWVYASRAANILDANSSKRTKASSALYDLERVEPIANYEYARTRFLALSESNPDRYIPLGYRLLLRRSSDYPVKFALVYLVYSKNPTEAKRLNSQLLRDFPAKVAVLAQRGDVFDVAYLRSKVKSDVLEAKKYYELFLLKAPKTNSYREMVKLRLDRINKTLRSL